MITPGLRARARIRDVREQELSLEAVPKGARGQMPRATGLHEPLISTDVVALAETARRVLSHPNGTASLTDAA